jgi:hypothetical protein
VSDSVTAHQVWDAGSSGTRGSAGVRYAQLQLSESPFMYVNTRDDAEPAEGAQV